MSRTGDPRLRARVRGVVSSKNDEPLRDVALGGPSISTPRRTPIWLLLAECSRQRLLSLQTGAQSHHGPSSNVQPAGEAGLSPSTAPTGRTANRGMISLAKSGRKIMRSVLRRDLRCPTKVAFNPRISIGLGCVRLASTSDCQQVYVAELSLSIYRFELLDY